MNFKNRREFLAFSLKTGVSAAALSSLQLQAVSGLASQQSDLSDYKALVCFYLHGGSDSLNMLIPLQGDPLSAYLDSRQNLAVTNPLPIQPTTEVDGGIGLHPSLSALKPLFEQKRLAVVPAVGSLIAPITYAQYKQGGASVPGYLFSHNDQQDTWMRGREKESLNYGWGGRLLEALEANNNFAANISLSGNNLWQTGPSTNVFSMNRSGITPIYGLGTSSRSLAFRAQLEEMFANASQPMAKSYSRKLNQSLSNTELLNSALASATNLDAHFDAESSLSEQFKSIAKTISVQSTLGVGRQIFFVSMGGFDTHDNQVTEQPQLLSKMSQAMVEFDSALTELNLQQQVTTFTMSDFGRTLSSNGDGTDHGWAGNHLMMGGAVQGGEIYGKVLEQALGSEYDVKGGRMIPQIATEQYFATLAQWFGASNTDLYDLFPNLKNFNEPTLNIFS